MHLEIIQPKSARETVSLGVINKLYELAYENASLGITSQLDNTSDIVGSVSLYAADKKKVEYLAGTNGVGGNGRFQDFNIYCTTYYLNFLDDAFAQVCANVYGNGEGTTTADLVGIENLNLSGHDLVTAMNGNTTVTTMDFRQFPKLALNGTFIWSQRYVQNVYVNVASTINPQNFNDLGPLVNGKPYLDKLIIGELNWTDTVHPNLAILHGSVNNNCSYGTLAIRNIYAPSNATRIHFGDYATRNGVTYTNLYLGHCYIGDTETTITYSQEAYGDNLSRITNIYVPVGMRQAYIDNGTWVHSGTARTDFIEYDFDTDPDGIFSVLNT